MVRLVDEALTIVSHTRLVRSEKGDDALKRARLARVGAAATASTGKQDAAALAEPAEGDAAVVATVMEASECGARAREYLSWPLVTGCMNARVAPER